MAAPRQKASSKRLQDFKLEIWRRWDCTALDNEHVEAALAQRGDLLRNGPARQRQSEPALLACRVSQERRRQHGTRSRAKPDPNLSSRATALQSDDPGQFIGFEHDMPRMFEHHPAESRNLVFLADPIDKSQPKLRLELGNAARQGRLSQMDPLRRPGEGPGLRESYEVTKLLQIHPNTMTNWHQIQTIYALDTYKINTR